MRRFAFWAIGCLSGFTLAWGIAVVHGTRNMHRSLGLYLLNFVLFGLNFGFLALLLAQRFGKLAPRPPSGKRLP